MKWGDEGFEIHDDEQSPFRKSVTWTAFEGPTTWRERMRARVRVRLDALRQLDAGWFWGAWWSLALALFLFPSSFPLFGMPPSVQLGVSVGGGLAMGLMSPATAIFGFDLNRPNTAFVKSLGITFVLLLGAWGVLLFLTGVYRS